MPTPFWRSVLFAVFHMGEVKRAKLSGPDVNTSHAPKSEIGVCLGTDPVFPGTYIFYICV
jgi:hypothetical protein